MVLFVAVGFVPHEKILTELGDYSINYVRLNILVADGLRLKPSNKVVPL